MEQFLLSLLSEGRPALNSKEVDATSSSGDMSLKMKNLKMRDCRLVQRRASSHNKTETQIREASKSKVLHHQGWKKQHAWGWGGLSLLAPVRTQFADILQSRKYVSP